MQGALHLRAQGPGKGRAERAGLRQVRARDVPQRPGRSGHRPGTEHQRVHAIGQAASGLQVPFQGRYGQEREPVRVHEPIGRGRQGHEERRQDDRRRDPGIGDKEDSGIHQCAERYAEQGAWPWWFIHLKMADTVSTEHHINKDPHSRHLTAPAGFMPPHTEHFFWSSTSVTPMNDPWG